MATALHSKSGTFSNAWGPGTLCLTWAGPQLPPTLDQAHRMLNKSRLNTHQDIWTLLAWTLGEGDGAPLYYSCLENPMDGGAW